MSALDFGVTPEQTLQKVNDDHTMALAESYLTSACYRKLTLIKLPERFFGKVSSWLTHHREN
jgi:hypothetical protein